MWRLKQFLPRESSSIEGKIIDVGRHRVQVRSVIAQGGFSVVYLAKDSQSGRSYALKHIICSNEESLDLVKKEIRVMEVLKGHPNVVTLYEYHVGDNLGGKGKECYLLMDYCEKMLVNILDARGGVPLSEKDLLLQYRDICNAVYAMHCQSPPIAHRDIKAENVLQQSDGTWRLCDFGSVSTNHKHFTSPEEMGIEEDNIRKHTTPAYRAPEMWDLYRRELISEKVDIWAMGCLLYRMAFRKLPFDGDSKLQILNGNYRVPESSSYSTTVTELIKSMLQPKPEDRPTILQVWQRVNEGLPGECRLKGPDRPPARSQSRAHLTRQGSAPSRDFQSYAQSGGQTESRGGHPSAARRVSHDSGPAPASRGGGQFWARHGDEPQLSPPDASTSAQEKAKVSPQPTSRRNSSSGSASTATTTTTATRSKDHWMDELSRNLSSSTLDNNNTSSSAATWQQPLDNQSPASNWASFDDTTPSRTSAADTSSLSPEVHRGVQSNTVWASFGDDAAAPPQKSGGGQEPGLRAQSFKRSSAGGGGSEGAGLVWENSYEAPQTKSNVSRGSFWSQYPDAVQTVSVDDRAGGSRSERTRSDSNHSERSKVPPRSSGGDNGRKEHRDSTGAGWTAFS